MYRDRREVACEARLEAELVKIKMRRGSQLESRNTQSFPSNEDIQQLLHILNREAEGNLRGDGVCDECKQLPGRGKNRAADAEENDNLRA